MKPDYEVIAMVDGEECINATIYSDSEMRCDFPAEDTTTSTHVLYVSINGLSTSYVFKYRTLFF